MNHRFTVALIALVPLAAACSAGSFPITNDGGADGSTAGDGGGSNDGGTGSDGAGTATKGGGIYLTGWDYVVQSTAVQGMSASASFVGSFPTGTGACTTTTSGACTVTQCPIGGTSDAGTSATVSAGTIDITGGNKAIELLPSGNTYNPVTQQTKLWSGGETFEVTASGATVPPFDLTVTAPSYVTITSPTFPTAGNKFPIVRSQTLAVSWSGGGAGQVSVGLTGSTASSSTSISCVFPASSGSGSVPSTVLGSLPTAATSASISILGQNVTESVVSGYAIRVQMMTLAKTSSGTATAAATIQ